MNPAQFLISRELIQLESDVHLAITQIRRARTLHEVRHAMRLPSYPYLVGMSEASTQLMGVRRAAENRAGEIVQQQLEGLRKAQTLPECLAEHGRLRQDWELLRGELGVHYDRTLRAAQVIVDSKRAQQLQSDTAAEN